jgi:hypothetical protein
MMGMSSLASLPDDVLKLIMNFVPLRDRLGQCCMVSKRMHSAAVAATQDVTLSSMSTERAVSLLKWLPHHGDRLTRLELAVPQQHELRQLPCPDLLDLSIRFCRVQLSAADGFPGVFQECTKLTRLYLLCEIVDAPGGPVADSLSSLVHLQHLRINVPAATLPCMHHLTYLEGYSLSVESLLQMGGLSSLQELHLSAAGDTAVGPSSVPGLSFPASLKTLVLLSPVEAGILSLVPPGLQHLTVHRDVEGPAEGPGSILSYMAQLKHLTQLSLWPNSMVVFVHLPPAGPAYAALTASSSLVRLEFCPLECPDGIWQYVFATHKLPHLTELKLADTLGWGEGVPYPSWGGADISSLISCCPNLRVAETLSLQPGLHVSELRKLTALTLLSANIDRPDWFDYEGCVSGLAAVTQLWRLVVRLGSDTVKVAHLLPLTSLTALTLFEVDVNNVDEDEHLWLNTPVSVVGFHFWVCCQHVWCMSSTGHCVVTTPVATTCCRHVVYCVWHGITA